MLTSIEIKCTVDRVKLILSRHYREVRQEDIEDAVQDAFVKCWKIKMQWLFDKVKYGKLLYTVAEHELLNSMKKVTRFAKFGIEMLESSLENIEVMIETDIARDEIYDFMSRYPLLFPLMELHDQGFSPYEIKQKLQISDGCYWKRKERLRITVGKLVEF